MKEDTKEIVVNFQDYPQGADELVRVLRTVCPQVEWEKKGAIVIIKR